MRLRRALLSSAGPDAVLPDTSCAPAVAACLQSLDTLDTEPCGEAREVIACGALTMPDPLYPAITDLLVGTHELEVGSSTWVQVSFGARTGAGAVLTTTATGSMEPIDPIELDEGINFIQLPVFASDTEGPGSLTFSLGGASMTAHFDVFDGSCLVISEYIEGSNNNNKAIQLYNCSDHSLLLSNYYVCLIANDATSCTSTVRLEPEMISPGGIFGLCRSTAESGTNPYPQISSNCGQVASGPMNFNGDDRLLVFRDRDGSGSFTDGDDIMDAFGELAVRPPSLIWGNRTFRRCDFTPFDGLSPFDVHDYYLELPQDTVDGYGVQPDPSSISCL
jgi:large repetitive protein